MSDKLSMQALLDALGGASTALRVDDCGAWTICGRHGHVYSNGRPDDGWLIVVMNRSGSVRRWASDKQRLAGFTTATQDGDAEGVLWLRSLPNLSQAAAIRHVIGLRKAPALGATLSGEEASLENAF
jgi:hypothetical protein